MMGWDMGFGSGGVFFGGLMMILFWGVVIALIVLTIRSLTDRSGRSGYSLDKRNTQFDTPRSPLEIVKERYARGEINKAEFETLSQDLQTT